VTPRRAPTESRLARFLRFAAAFALWAMPGGLALADPPTPTTVGAGGDGPGSPAPSPAPPRIEFDREAHDFGVVRQEQDLTTEFTVRNGGGATLHVKEVRADCGCSKPRLEKREIAPGESVPLHVLFHTLKLEGTVTKRVRIASDDPARPEVTLRISVDVSAGLVVEHSLYFGPVLLGTAPSVSTVVKWKEGVGRAFRVTKLEAPGLDGIAFETKPYDEGKWHGVTVVARFREPPPIGSVTGMALLRTDDPEYARIPLPVSATVSGRVWLDLRTVSFQTVPQGVERVVPVGLRGFSPSTDLGEVRARSTKGRVSVVAQRVAGRPNEWTLLIDLPETAQPGPVDDVVEVTTALADEPPTRIVVQGQVLPKR
jgi:hypothetical protein